MNKSLWITWMSLIFLFPFSTGHSKSHHWATYQQMYGKEKVKIKFPKTPTVENEEGIVFIYGSKRKVIYSLSTATSPMENIDPQQAFTIAIASLTQHPHYLMGYKITKKEGWDILDATSQDYSSEYLTKMRMIITKKNFYILKTLSPLSEKEEHDYFLDSFSIS